MEEASFLGVSGLRRHGSDEAWDIKVLGVQMVHLNLWRTVLEKWTKFTTLESGWDFGSHSYRRNFC